MRYREACEAQVPAEEAIEECHPPTSQPRYATTTPRSSRQKRRQLPAAVCERIVKGVVGNANRAACHRRTARLALFQSITNMNRSSMTDSNLSLDMGSLAREFRFMVTQPYQLYIERTDPSKNMARFYAMSIEPTLFGETCLTRCWGRIGTAGQKRVQNFAREQDAVVLFLDLVRQKRSRGYSAVGKTTSRKP